MPKQAAGSTARDRILSRARALDDDNKKYQHQMQQVQQVRREDTVPMRYRQGTPLAQQPQTTAKERILSRAKAMGPQEIMSGNGDLTVEEYQYALKQAEAASPKRDENPGFFSRVGKWLVGKTEKTPEEIVAEQWDALEAARKREELASLDLDEYEKLLEQAKKQAADARPDFNIHAMGAYDAAAENTPAQRKADEMQQTYNLAKQVQFERQGEQALAQLTPKQLEAVETLVQTPATGTSVMSAGVARENARDQAYSVLLEGGYSYKTISDLVTWRSRQQDKEAYQKTVQWHEDLADSGVLGGAAATVLSVPENLLSGVGAIDVALQKANQTGGEERPVNYYSAPMRLYGGANAARETVGQKLERNTDATIFGQNVASTAYGIGTSMLDSGATVALAAIGVPPVVGSSLLGGAAATGAMVDAKDRGVDDTHALWTGVFAGVAETLFEDVSLEKLLKLDVPQGTLRQRMQTTLKNTLLQAGTEGSEELFTDFANYITDRAINGGLSEYDTAVRAYMDQGLSQKEASQKAGADLAARMAMDFVAGGVAGGLMAGGKAAIDNAGQNREMRQYSDLAPAAAEERLAADPGSRAARRVQKQVQQGKPVSGAALRETMAQNVEAQNQAVTEQVRKLAQQRLEELGDTQAEKTSRAVAQLYDQELPWYRRELARKALRSSEYGQRVANEMEEAMGRRERTEDTDQGTTAAWAENLPRYTSRGEYISELHRKRVNPQATDRRPVTGYKYNAETGQLDAIVKGEDGKTETIPKEKAATTGQQEMLAYLAEDLKEGAPAMIASYLDGQDLETYSRQWHNAYEYGAANVKRDYAMASQAVDQLNETQRGIAYDTGKAVYDQRMDRERQKFPQESKGAAITREGTLSLKGATVGGVTYTPVTQKTMTRRQRDSVDVMRQLARVTGVDVVFYQSRANEKGEYTAANGFYRDGTVYLDINAGKNRVGDMSETAILLTASHELTHFIKEYNPAQYEQLRDFVVERLTEAEDVDLDDLVQRHQKNQPELSYDEALDEVVADGCQMMLKDSQAAAALAKQNRSLAGNIRSWLRKWVKKLQEAFRGLTAQKPEAQALTRYAKEMQKIWDDALVGAARNLQQSEVETASGEEAASTRGKASARDGESAAQVRYEVRESKDKDIVSVKQQLKASESELSKMPVVSRKNVTADIERMSTKQRLEWAVAELRASGYRVERPNGNTIEFSPKDINSGLRYLSSAGEIAAYSALPAVLKRGKEIYREANHKGRGYGTITFAAPVEINGVRGNMAVVVRQTKGQRYDVHRILMPDGSAFVFQEKANAVSTTVGGITEAASSSGGTTPTINTASTDSIRPGNEKSNTKFSMREPVEQAKDLVAVHNLTEQNLQDALDLGGLPMPSIAVVKSEQGHSMYGPISIVFGRDSIDPQADSRNKIYGGDAYTPTAPAVEYPVNYDRMRAVEKRLAGLSEKIAGGVFRNDSALQRAGIDEESGMSAAELADKLARDDSIRAAYLADQGKTLEPVMQKKEFNRYGNDALAKLVQQIGAQELAGIEASIEAGDYQPVREIEDMVRQIIRDSYAEKHSALLNRKPELKEKRLDRFMENNVTVFTVEDFVRDAWEYYQDQGATTSEIDRWATSDKLHEAASVEDVKVWLLPQLEGVLGEPGIYNGSERFDRSGSRRSFSQLHWKYTLENIVRAMTETQAARGGQTFGASATAMQAVGSEDFQSIDEVKAASGRLGEVDTEQYKADVDAVEKRIEQATRAVMRENKPHSDNQFDEMQIIGDVMMQAAQGKQTEAAIRRAFSQEGYSISESTAREIREVFRAATALPTGYFEAKPQRAVRFDEAKAVIVPDNISRTLKKRIESAGVPIMEYRAGDESQRLKQLNSDETWRFSVREAKITDRELLANALETTAQNAEERRILKWYREVAKSLTEHEQLLENMRQRLADHKSGEKALSPGKVKDLEDYTEYIVNKLDEEDRKLLKIESMGPVRKLLEREREYVERRLAGAREEKDRYRAEFEQRLQDARRREQESLVQYRERREESERRRAVTAKIERTTRQLADRLNTNTDKKHIPEPLKRPVAQLLTALDYSSRSSLRGDRATRADQEYCRAMEGIRRVLADQEAFQQGTEGSEDALGGYLDLPPGLTDLMTKHIQTVENIIEDRMPTETVLRRMNLTQLRDLDVILSTITQAVTKMNELLENRTFVRVADAAEDTMAELHRRGQYKGAAEKAETFVAWDNTLPWYAFQRFGEGGRAIFGELQDGWDKLAFNSKQVLDFRKSVITDEQARAWDTEVRQVELLDQEGETVTVSMTTAQLMGLYCLSKRKQAMGHLFGGGIRITDIETRGKLRKKTIKQDEHYKMDDQMLGRLLGQLTPEQIAVADKLQQYMTEQGSKWGNEVTMKRFGYRGFTEKIYYPIETDSQDRLSRAGDGTEGSLYRLQNISAVKPLVQNANNAIMLRGIFDVFSNHMADMAKYNALVIPIVDAQKWYNYKDSVKNEAGQVNTRTVQRAMTKAYGQSANRYVVQFLKDLNGVKESGARGEAFADKMISNYKRAAVAANLRVALLQPTAYVRAAAVLDYKYLAKAFGDRTGTRQATAEMLEHSGIALWKDMGFFDTDVGRSIRDQIKGKGSKLEDLVDKSMAAAELGDKVTWARLWRACKLEVQEKQGLSGDELMKATAQRFRDVIYQTQVIDSTMTRSHIMRSSSTFSKMFTSFMSEPTVSYNLIMEGTRQILKDKKAMGLKTAIGRNWKTAGRAYQAYVVSALAAAVVESLADALRDDDDDTLWEKLWNAFGGLHGNLASDLNPLNKLPYMRDVFSALDGYDNGRMDTEGLANAKKAYDILMESYRLATGQQDKATSTTYYGNMTTYGKVYQTFRAVSMLSGLPLSAATREVITTWNNTVGSVWPGLKCKTYESKKLREAYNSYAKPAGISYDALSTAMEYVATLESDKDAEGKTVSGSLKAKYVAYIQSMGLTPSQQKAMWLALKNSTWSDKGTPWE
nr:MAG TPA: nuclease [Caudoviricetes sp.]